MLTTPTYKHLTGAGTTVCKYAAGTLHSIIVNNPANQSITVYDNVTGGGTVIAIINPGTSAVPFMLTYGCNFNIGLTVVLGGTLDCTIIFE